MPTLLKAPSPYRHQLIHGMNGFASVGNLSSETSATKIHQMVQVDCDIAILRNGEDSTGAIVAAVGSVVNTFGKKVHKQKRLKPTR